jgi:hypothetical protein
MRLSKFGFVRAFLGLLFTLAMVSVTAHSQAFATGVENVIFNFNALGTGATGSYPHSTPIMDAQGNLYGTAPNGGTHNVGVVWELSPPATSGGTWTQTILWNFNNNGTDGYLPWTWGSGLVFDSHGNLYGTTQAGGTYNEGAAWELSPPATSGGAWTETILWSFGKPGTTDGIDPTSGLTIDKNGNLFGTTLEGQTSTGGAFDGTVFKLSPPSAGGNPGWNETILMQFAAGGAGNPYLSGFFPYAGVIGDGSGDLFGTTSAGGSNYAGSDPGGVVFEISAGGGYSVLWNFGGTYGPSGVDDAADPVSGLIMDKLGNIYGTTALGGTSADFATGVNGVGTVFELSPPGGGGGSWSESVLWNFQNNGTDGFSPVAGVVVDPNGNLYGTTEYGGPYSDEPYVGGTVYKLTPPAMTGGSWGETILWDFGNPASTDGSLPWASLLIDPIGNLYGTTLDGGSFGVVGNGTVYEIPAEGLEQLVVNPTKINFGTVSVGTTSASQPATITSEFVDDVVDFFATFTIANFVKTGTTCGASLGPLQSCQVNFACKPKTTGPLIGAYAFLYGSVETSAIMDGDDHLKIGVVQFTCTGS